MGELIDRIRSSDFGHFGLDHDIMVAAGLAIERIDGLKATTFPEVTVSIDAALRMAEKLLPGHRFGLYTDGGGRGPYAMVMIDDDPVCGESYAKTLPLALCAAALVALNKARTA